MQVCFTNISNSVLDSEGCTYTTLRQVVKALSNSSAQEGSGDEDELHGNDVGCR